ncbi:hypothetical protein GCM10010176_073090 [Nonomuraea spiralis]|nr:hypothetical protein [Nonomuraea spiralis]GGT17951.1 hypothetical protein GCM10010176_073090 [Nonomuraea spiralis]
MSKAGPLAPVLDALLRIDPQTRLDSVRASLMLARVAAGGSAEEPLAPRRPVRPVPVIASPPFARRPAHRGLHRAEATAAALSVPAPRQERRAGEGVHRRRVEARPTPSTYARFKAAVIKLFLPRRFWPRELRKRG